MEREFARERSNQDFQSSVDYGKTLFQILIGANGLAATALLTLAGALKQPKLTPFFSIPIIIYLAGVLFGTLGAISLFQSKDRYGYRWLLRFMNGKVSPEENKEREKANKYQNWAMCWIKCSMIMFTLGGVSAALIIYFKSASGCAP